MSASDKKKLRNEQKAEQLTERQLTEQKEAKKLKILTIVMVVVIAAMVVFAIGTAIYNSVVLPMVQEKEAEAQRNTVAATVGEHDISAAEFNCFYVDAVSNFYNQVGSYAALYGLDVTKPLDEQTYSEEEGTWADYFKTSAESNIKSVYSIVDEAEANGFALTEDDQKYIDSQMSYMTLYAIQYGYSNVDDYLAAMYGAGANEETVRAYFELCYTAQMYQEQIAEGQSFTDADIQARDEEDPNAYSYFSYNSYYLATSKFLEGGVENEDGTKTYTDEEKAAAVAAAEAAAKSLTSEEITSIEALDTAIKALEINADLENASGSSAYTENTYSYIASPIQAWVADASRQAGDMTYIPSTTTDADGNESVAGYYVVYFVGRNDNDVLLQNVRHILFAFEGGTTDSSGNTTYSDEEKAAALEKAEALYEEWKAGDATEDSFATLANENSADSDGTDGGLYTDIYPGQMVEAFEDWCFDESRQAGDTGIVETEYGYHIMYYVGAADYTYRQYMIENTLVNEAVQAWHDELVAGITVTEVNYEYVPTGMVLNANSSY